MNTSVHTINHDALSGFATNIIDTCIYRSTKKSQAKILVLTGDLGAGKTTFSQYCIAVLGITEDVQSPTFVIAREYSLPIDTPLFQIYRYEKIIHMDAYRISDMTELGPLQFDTWIHDSKNIIFIEWGDLIRSALSVVQYTELVFSIVDETTRKIEVKEM